MQIDECNERITVIDSRMDLLEEQADLIAKNLSKVVLTVVDGSGKAEPNIPITNLKDSSGNIVSTNASGLAVGYVTSGSVTLSISGYVDIASASITFSAEKGKLYNERMTVSRNNFKALTSTQNIKFSSKVNRVDYSIVGGGGGGAGWGRDSSDYRYGGGGGGGGYGINDTFYPRANTSYSVQVGAGGTITATISDAALGRPGGSGGTSSFNGKSASGGSGGGSVGSGRYDPSYRLGGAGNGNGGNGFYRSNTTTAGSSGSGVYYSSFTGTSPYGGGGGGGGYIGAAGASGGSPNGGVGGYGGSTMPNTAVNAGNGSVPGGGGGGDSRANDYDHVSPGRGGSGIVTLRMYFT